jgi:thymidylate kinase
MGLPAPDLVLFVDVDLNTSLSHLRKRETETDTNADIHERDNVYLDASITAARTAAKLYDWRRLDGSASVEEIAEQVAKEAEMLWKRA